MTKNPIINALASALYIALVANFVFHLPKAAIEESPSALAPMAMITLFSLSAAMMAYLFVSQPLRLYIDGEKQRAVTLFLQTLGTFALITVAIFAVILWR